MLDLTGIGKDRLHLAWVSSAEAQRFARIAAEVTATIKDQDSFDQRAFELELEAALMTVSAENLRWLVSKELKIAAKGDVYGRKWDTDSYETIMDSVLDKSANVRDWRSRRCLICSRIWKKQTGLPLRRWKTANLFFRFYKE